MPEINQPTFVPPAAPTSPVFEQPVKSKGLFLPIAAVAAVILIIGLAFGSYQLGKSQVSAPGANTGTNTTAPGTGSATVSATVPNPSLTPIIPADPTANWETYTATDFLIKYPGSLVAEQLEGKLFLYIEGVTPTESETFVPNITIGNVYKKPANFTDTVSWARASKITFPNLSKDSVVLLGNNRFVTFEADSGPTAYAIHYLIDNISSIYDFSVRIVGSHENEGKRLTQFLPQILSTFKFLVPVSVSNNPASFYDFVGVINLKGYLEPVTRGCSFTETGTCTVKLAIFKVTGSDNTNFNNYLKQLAGNSYVTDDGVSLGCLDTSKQQISSDNDSDAGPVQSLITGSQYNLLMSSNPANPVNLSIERPKYTGGRQADDCYSHFRNFRVY